MKKRKTVCVAHDNERRWHDDASDTLHWAAHDFLLNAVDGRPIWLARFGVAANEAHKIKDIELKQTETHQLVANKNPCAPYMTLWMNRKAKNWGRSREAAKQEYKKTNNNEFEIIPED